MARVLVLTTSYPRFPGDPSGHFIETEALDLARSGHAVTVIAPGRGATSGSARVASSDAPAVLWLADGGAFGWPGALPRLRERPWRALGAGLFALRAARALEQLAPFDRVVAHFLVPCAWPTALLGLRRHRHTALEVVAHGSDARLFAGLPPTLRRRIVAALAGRGATLRCVSSSVKELLAEGGMAPLIEHAAVRPCAIDVSAVPTRAQARQRLGLAETDQLAVIVGRLIAEKRVDVALRALALLPNLRVVVIGDGPERGRLEAAFSRARFAGNLPRQRALLHIAAADALVSASRHEGAPTVVREARALGVPVVSPPAGDLGEQARSDAGIFLV